MCFLFPFVNVGGNEFNEFFIVLEVDGKNGMDYIIKFNIM